MENEAITYSQDLINLLLIQVPGFFFLKGLFGWKYHANNGYELFIYSLGVGVLFQIFLQLDPENHQWLSSLFDQPYAGSLVFSTQALTYGWILRGIIRLITRPFEVDMGHGQKGAG